MICSTATDDREMIISKLMTSVRVDINERARSCESVLKRTGKSFSVEIDLSYRLDRQPERAFFSGIVGLV